MASPLRGGRPGHVTPPPPRRSPGSYAGGGAGARVAARGSALRRHSSPRGGRAAPAPSVPPAYPRRSAMSPAAVARGLALAALLVLSPAGATRQARRPNVVLILTDDQDVCLGGMVTPPLPRLPLGLGPGRGGGRVGGSVEGGRVLAQGLLATRRACTARHGERVERARREARVARARRRPGVTSGAARAQPAAGDGVSSPRPQAELPPRGAWCSGAAEGSVVMGFPG